MLHNIVIKQRKVYLPNRNFVQGGINSDEVAVFPDLEWEDCDTLLITMKNENVDNPGTYLIKPGEPLLIPKAILEKPGLLYFSFTGYVGEEKRITTEAMTHVYAGRVHKAGIIAEEGEDSHPDELDFLASLIKEVQDILDYLKGGADGALDYTVLVNKPQIEGIVLEGNKLLSEFGVGSISTEDINNICR